MTDEVNEAQENIIWITKHKAANKTPRDLGLELDWV